MRDDREELVDARPGDGPGGASFGETAEPGRGAVVPVGVGAVGVDEDVRVDCDHAKRS